MICFFKDLRHEYTFNNQILFFCNFYHRKWALYGNVLVIHIKHYSKQMGFGNCTVQIRWFTKVVAKVSGVTLLRYILVSDGPSSRLSLILIFFCVESLTELGNIYASPTISCIVVCFNYAWTSSEDMSAVKDILTSRNVLIFIILKP